MFFKIIMVVISILTSFAQINKRVKGDGSIFIVSFFEKRLILCIGLLLEKK